MTLMARPVIQFVVDPEDRELFSKAAHREQKTLSEWIRDSLRVAAAYRVLEMVLPLELPLTPGTMLPIPAAIVPRSAQTRWTCPCGQVNMWRDSCSRCNEPRP